MKRRKISYFEFFILSFTMIILIFMAGCSGISLIEPIINSFSADPTTITVGDSSVLSWSITGANNVTIDNGVGSVTSTGNTMVNPVVTTTYTLTATNSTGSVTAMITVTVNPLPGFITVEGEYSGFYNFPKEFFESSTLAPEDVVKVTDRIYLLEKELASGDVPFSFAKGEYKEDVYGCASLEGFVLGEYASPANNKGHHSWDVIAHEIGHSFWWWSNFFYTLAVPGPFLQESTAVLTAQYVYERIKQEPNNFNLPQDAIASLDAVYTEEREYQRGRYEEYINLGKPYSQDESSPNYAILTSQALNYKWFLIGDEYGWEKFQRFYKGFSTDLKDDFTFWQDGVSDIEETTYMIAALNVAFNQDFRQEFRDLNFPINDDLYNEIYPIILEYIN